MLPILAKPRLLQETPLQICIGLEYTGKAGRDHRHIWFAHAPCCHTLMLCINQNGHAFRLQDRLDGFSNLCGEGFLRLQAPCKAINDTRQFRNANNTPVWHIGDMCRPLKWAQDDVHNGFPSNIAQHHHVIIAFDLFKGALQACWLDLHYSQHKILPMRGPRVRACRPSLRGLGRHQSSATAIQLRLQLRFG